MKGALKNVEAKMKRMGKMTGRMNVEWNNIWWNFKANKNGRKFLSKIQKGAKLKKRIFTVEPFQNPAHSFGHGSTRNQSI